MTVRAVYLKLNNDLSPNSFIMALRRLKSRQGHVSVIWSDKGTNLFVGAASELKDAFRTIGRSKVNCYFCAQKMYFKWIFHPPF